VLLVMLCRPSALSLASLSSHIDAAVDLVLLDYAGDVPYMHTLCIVAATFCHITY